MSIVILMQTIVSFNLCHGIFIPVIHHFDVNLG